MSRDWKAEMAAAVAVIRENLDDQQARDVALTIINDRLDAFGLRTKVWGSMIYRCERDGCHHIELYELEVGVEGPPAWRQDLTYIACAFTAGRCEHCGGPMSHWSFKDDDTYDQPRDPSALNVWRVPREWPVYPTKGMYDDGTVITSRGDSAFLSMNAKALSGMAS